MSEQKKLPDPAQNGIRQLSIFFLITNFPVSGTDSQLCQTASLQKYLPVHAGTFAHFIK